MAKRNMFFWGAAAAAVIAGVSPAQAQQPAPSTPQAANEGVEEIVVTARKRAESLQDTPVAVSAFTSESIEELGLRDVSDLSRFTPGLVFQQAFGRSGDRPVVRGQSNVLANVQFGVESGTAYFVDGVYYPGSLQYLDFGQVERVEVIKGPQSALYGRNTYAGAINFVMKSPGEKFHANATARAAEHGEYEVNLGVSGPLLGDKLSGALYGRYYTYDGEHKNFVTDQLVGSEESRVITGVLEAKLHKDWDLRFRTSLSRDQDGPLPIFLQDASFNNCAPGTRALANWTVNGLPASTNNNQYYCGVVKPGQVRLNTGPAVRLVQMPGVPVPPFSAANVSSPANPYSLADGTAFDGIDRNVLLGSIVSDWDMGGSGYLMSFNHGFRFERYKFGTDSDHSSVNWFTSGPTAEPFLANTTANQTRDFSTELRISSPTTGKWNWLVGAFHYVQADRQRDITFSGVSPMLNKLETENVAAFGMVEFHPTDKLSISAEGRYTTETKKRYEPPAGTNPVYEREIDFQAFTPRITVDYKVNDDLMVYGVFAEGVKPGGLNGREGVATGRPEYQQEESTNFEVGAKSTWFDGKVTANVSAYYTQASNVQVTQAIPGSTGAVNSVAVNQAEGEIRGFEAELNAQPTDRLSMRGTYAFTDTEFTKGCDDFQWTLTSGGGRISFNSVTGAVTVISNPNGAGNCSIAGKQFPLTAKHSASFAATYRQPFSDTLGFFATGDVNYESSKFTQVHNLAETGDSMLVGLRTGLETDNFTVTLFGRNLTDEDSVVAVTRWLQPPYSNQSAFFAQGLGTRNINCSTATVGAACVVPSGVDTGQPRAFFGTLRKGRTFGVEAKLKF